MLSVGEERLLAKILVLYRKRAHWTDFRSVRELSGALSIQRFERSRPSLRRTRRIMGFVWGLGASEMGGEVSTVVALRKGWAFEVPSREQSGMVQEQRTR